MGQFGVHHICFKIKVDFEGTHQATLSTLSKQHVRLHHKAGGVEPWLLVCKLVEVCCLCHLQHKRMQLSLNFKISKQ